MRAISVSLHSQQLIKNTVLHSPLLPSSSPVHIPHYPAIKKPHHLRIYSLPISLSTLTETPITAMAMPVSIMP
jgi:hypothetical protein